MKEITAIIRREKVPETKRALEAVGYPSMSIQSVEGRGKQKGAMCADMDAELPEAFCASVKLTPTPSTYAVEHALPKAVLYVPKRCLTMMVPDEAVSLIVKTIIEVNSSGKRGDGKIFVSPVECAIRVRTGERGLDAIS